MVYSKKESRHALGVTVSFEGASFPNPDEESSALELTYDERRLMKGSRSTFASPRQTVAVPGSRLENAQGYSTLCLCVPWYSH